MAFEITIPRLGWSMEEGTFAGWLKKDGDRVSRGDVLFELEGEKALQEIEAVDEGILRLPPSAPQPGTVLKVGTVIAYLASEVEPCPWADLASAVIPATSSAETESSAPTQTQSAAASPSVRRLARELKVSLTSMQGTGKNQRITEDDIRQAVAKTPQPSLAESGSPAHATSATPRARRTALKLGIDWRTLVGTGRGGRVRERDVLTPQAATTVTDQETIEPIRSLPPRRLRLSGRRSVIAQRLTESVRQTVPVTLTCRVDAGNLVGLRQQFRNSGSSEIPAIHDIVAKLTAAELLRFPLLAARWDGDELILPHADRLHIGIAVDTEDGLTVPVLKSPASTPLSALARESAALIERARSGRLASSDLDGAVFTISNLGHLGIDAFTPVINYPETAILGLGAIRKEPVVIDDGTITTGLQMTLSLTFDHRVIDGAPAARFLQSLSRAIANPAAALLQ
jgi:pyruvate dehydrogenase E2 component (dihydrolipoamide acetyltransferase)